MGKKSDVSAEEHRDLVRKCLLKTLEAGHSPLRYFLHDLKKYFYLAEVMSLVDLSLVTLRFFQLHSAKRLQALTALHCRR